jgi:hypothetical protein
MGDGSGRRGSVKEVPLAEWPLADSSSRSAFIVCRLFRTGVGSRRRVAAAAASAASASQWQLGGVPRGGVDGRSFGDLLPAMQELLRDLLPSIVVDPRPDVIVLTKGESAALTSGDTKSVPSAIRFGLGWDAAGSEPIDLDASCLMFGSKNELVDSVFFNALRSKCGSVQHAGGKQRSSGALPQFAHFPLSCCAVMYFC